MNFKEITIRRYIVIHGYLGLDNIGDEASFEVIFNSIKGEKQNVIAASHIDPIETGKMFNVRTVKAQITNFRFILTLLRSTDLIFAGGGRYGYSTLRYMSILSILGRLFGVKVTWKSIGAYDYIWDGNTETIKNSRIKPPNILDRTIITLALRLSNYISVRDKYSFKVIKGIYGRCNVKIESDLVLGLYKVVEKNKHIKFSDHNRKIKNIGISLRNMKMFSNDPSFFVNVCNFINSLLCNNVDVVLIPFGNGRSKSTEDFNSDTIFYDKIINEIYKMNSNKVYNISIMGIEGIRPSDVLLKLRDVDFMICNRFHSLVFADILGIPLIALVYDTKMSEYLKERKVSSLVKAYKVSEINWNEVLSLILKSSFFT